MARMLRSVLATLAVALAFAGAAEARGGNYVFEGGSLEAQAQVRAALEASRFNWSLVPQQITIRITNCGCAGAKPGLIVLDEKVLLDPSLGPRYAWGLVQDEYAHQVDFFLLNDGKRKQLRRMLGGKDWCYEISGLLHDDHGCERFSAVVAWAYWRSADNVQAPRWAGGAKLSPVKFRKLLDRLVRT